MERSRPRPRPLPRQCRAATAVAAACLLAVGCGAPGGGDPANTPPPLQVTVGLDAATRYQTMQGFGGAVAFYVNWLAQHPASADIYEAVFSGLGLQMLRVGNWYQNATGTGFDDTVAVVQGARASLGAGRPLIEMSSWSPPASMKSNANTRQGTLAKGSDGQYRYADFGQWWAAALGAYAAAGAPPDYISLQNEPDFLATGWESCLFDAREGANAGYGAALDAVASAIAGLSPRPKILAPEVSGVAGDRMQSYLTALSAAELAGVDGLAHHLYSGGNGSMPTSFNSVMTQLAAAGAGANKPLFMTEYGPTSPDMFNTAWLIHNAVTVEGVSAYLYWPLTWAPPAAGSPPVGLVTTENPFNQAGWQTAAGWQINDLYYAVRHFSKWIDAGWQRAGVASSQNVVKASAYLSPDGQRATLVLLNTDLAQHDVTIDAGGFAFATSAVYRTSGTDERTAALGALAGDGVVTMPGRSLVTVTLAP